MDPKLGSPIHSASQPNNQNRSSKLLPLTNLGKEINNMAYYLKSNGGGNHHSFQNDSKKKGGLGWFPCCSFYGNHKSNQQIFILLPRPIIGYIYKLYLFVCFLVILDRTNSGRASEKITCKVFGGKMTCLGGGECFCRNTIVYIVLD